MTRRLLLCLLASCFAVASAASSSSSSAATASPFRSDPWTLHDPGFPVAVRVGAFEDDGAWLWPAGDPNASDAALHVASTVLHVEVELPAHVRDEDVDVFMALFDASSDSRVVVDAQLRYGRKYRLDVGAGEAESRLVLRVYVEATTSSAGDQQKATRRAFYARTLDFSPSAPRYLECQDDGEAARAASGAARFAAFPPPAMPSDLCSGYTMGGRVPVRKWYLDDQTDRDKSYGEYSFEDIEAQVRNVHARQQLYYGATDGFLYEAFTKYPLAGKHVLIMGSTFPWYEAMCLAFGAASCTTLDYNQVKYAHPKLRTFTVAEFARADPATTRKRFDVILSISSFEHDGLGRYGDPLNPDADLEAVRSLKQYAHPPCAAGTDEATKVFLAVPVGPDALVWNAQRIYGPLRLPLLLADWQILDSFGFAQSDFSAPFTVGHQPVFVLQSPDKCADAARPTDEL